MPKRDVEVVGVLLAAGCGKRFGMPKAIAMFDSVPLLVHQFRFFQATNLSKVVGVVGCEAERIERMLQSYDVPLIENRYWMDGQFSSLVCGIRHFIKEIEKGAWVMIHPIDVVGVSAQTIRLLISSISSTADAIVPSFSKRAGHPVLLSSTIAQELANTSSLGARLDRILHGSNYRTKYVAVEDEFIRNNINTKEDLTRTLKLLAG